LVGAVQGEMRWLQLGCSRGGREPRGGAVGCQNVIRIWRVEVLGRLGPS
jgi:hypothetical protein